MTEQLLRNQLLAKKRELGSWQAVGDWLGVPLRRAWDLANGHRSISTNIAKKMGYRLIKTRTYEPLEKV